MLNGSDAGKRIGKSGSNAFVGPHQGRCNHHDHAKQHDVARPESSAPRNHGNGQRERIDGSKGAVCGWGEQREGASLPEPDGCDHGLTCCYPCGIEGCDSVCEDVPHGECPELP